MPGFTLGLEDHVGDLKAFSDHHSAATSELESHLLAWQPSPHPLAYTGWADLLELALPCEPVALLFSVLTLLPHTLEAVASARH